MISGTQRKRDKTRSRLRGYTTQLHNNTSSIFILSKIYQKVHTVSHLINFEAFLSVCLLIFPIQVPFALSNEQLRCSHLSTFANTMFSSARSKRHYFVRKIPVRKHAGSARCGYTSIRETIKVAMK